jgi:hypothetical protein
MQKYFRNLLKRYISFYISDENSVLELDPIGEPILKETKLHRIGTLKSFHGKRRLQNSRINFLILNGNVHYNRDIQGYFEEIRTMIDDRTRLVIIFYNSLWKPVFMIAKSIGILRMPYEINWITRQDMNNFLCISGFESVKSDRRILVPIYIPIISLFLNRFAAALPVFQILSLVNFSIARPIPHKKKIIESVSIIVPARNEEGNIKNLLKRIPAMGPHDEIIFIEGHSTDATWKEIQSAKTYNEKNKKILAIKQTGTGKGDAVRSGFKLASNEILMILDADLSVSPEDLPKFYRAIQNGYGEFINGSRLVYPMEKKAMRFLNMAGNKFFASAFSFLLGQKIKDTLCGTKVIRRSDYMEIEKNRSYFGNFDPFGDFDLIFGSARIGLKVVEVPIVYRERIYGQTNIQRWRHGWLLLRMVLFAAARIKFI